MCYLSLCSGSWNLWATNSLLTSQPKSISLGPLNTHHALLVSNCLPANLHGRDLLYKFHVIIKYNEKGVFISLHWDQTPNLLLSLMETLFKIL